MQLKQELQGVKNVLEKERSKNEEQSSELKEAKLELDLKDKVCSTIKGQVESLGAELESVQGGMIKKEK